MRAVAAAADSLRYDRLSGFAKQDSPAAGGISRGVSTAGAVGFILGSTAAPRAGGRRVGWAGSAFFFPAGPFHAVRTHTAAVNALGRRGYRSDSSD